MFLSFFLFTHRIPCIKVEALLNDYRKISYIVYKNYKLTDASEEDSLYLRS